MFVRPKGVRTLCTLSCTGGFSTCILVPFLLLLPTPLHEVLYFRRHDFAARIVGFLGHSCQRERFRRCLWLASDRERRCVGSGLSSGPPWFGWVLPVQIRTWGHLHASLSLLFNGRRHAGVDDRKRPASQRRFLGTLGVSRKPRVAGDIKGGPV